jgi:hypothetical protein
MVGRSQASNLSGMLTSIGDTIGEMGGPGNQYVDTLRRSMAPKVEMNDSTSLESYANWARRNGYDEEADKYLALSYKRKAIEQKKEYDTGVAQGKEKLKGFDSSLTELDKRIKEQEALGVVHPDLLTARDKVAGARTSHITGMNDFGSASDYGDGTEGNKAEGLIIAEQIAAKKTDMEMEEAKNALMLQRAEIADLAAKGEKIPLSHLPDALREKYEDAWKKAEESYDPARAKRNLNSAFRQHADSYLAELAKGDDPNSIMMVARAESDLRKVDDDISEWMAKLENEPILKEARTQAREALKSNAAYRAASKEDKQVIAAETFRAILRSLSVDLDEEIEGYRNELESEFAENERERSVKGRDLAGAYDKGAEPNGKKYNISLERAMKANGFSPGKNNVWFDSEGNAFDRAEFDRQWDAKFWHPYGRAIQAHPSSPMGQSHPYSTPVWEQ